MVNEKKVCFITCVNKPELYAEAKLYLKHLAVPPGFETEYLPVYDAPSMTAGYNSAMKKSDAKYKVYLHQDTLLVNKNFIADIVNIFAEKAVGILGVIGCRSLPATGVWWDGMRTYGRVLHACEPESVLETRCMEPEEQYVEAEACDGLLLATQYDLPWREDLFTGWHFYDTSQCLEFRRRGYKVVIPRQEDFWCIHCPQEKPLAPTYHRYQQIFVKEYGSELNPEF